MATKEPITQEEHNNYKRLSSRIVPIISLIFIICLVAAIFYFYRNHPERIDALQEYGYLGAFLISVLLNATLVLPAGNFLVLAALGATLPSPWLVGIAGGLGAAFGEMTGYWAGYSGRAIIPQSKIYQRFEKWLDKWGMLTVFGLSVAPLFFDLVGLAAGVMRFPFWRFFLACWWGRTVLYIIIAWAGALGWDSLLDLLD